jgi:hypothetical protein
MPARRKAYGMPISPAPRIELVKLRVAERAAARLTRPLRSISQAFRYRYAYPRFSRVVALFDDEEELVAKSDRLIDDLKTKKS